MNTPNVNSPIVKEIKRFPALFIVFISLAIGISAAAWYFYSVREQLAKADIQEQLTTIADLKAEQIIRWRAERLNDARMLQTDKFLSQLFEMRLKAPRDTQGRQNLQQMLSKIVSIRGYRSAEIIDSSRTLRISTDSMAPLYEDSTVNALFRSTLKNNSVVMSDLYQDSCPFRNIHVSVFAPITGDKGSCGLGAIMLDIDPAAFLFPLIQSWPTPSKTAEVLLIRRDADSVLFLNELRHRKKTALQLHLPFRSDLPSAKAIAGFHGVMEGIDYRNVPVLAAAREIPGTSWFMIAKIDRSEALAPVARLTLRVAALTVLLVILAGVFIALYQRHRTSRIYKKLYLSEKEKNDLAASLLMSEERFYRLFSNMTEGVALHEIIFNTEGIPCNYRILTVNPSYEKHTGLSPKRASGVLASELYGTIDPPYLREYSAVAITGKPYVFETFFPPMNKQFSVSAFSPGKNQFATVFEDITARKHSESERESTIRLLSLLNAKNNTHDLMKSVTVFIQSWSGCEAVGIRLKDGEDYPYFETRGFPSEFVALETSLCAKDLQGQLLRNDIGDPIIECMCGNVICGRFDSIKPFFTKKGSFWSNCTTKLLASTTEADRQAATRNRCNRMGYESVALIRLKFGEKPIGLIQINDKRTERFTLGFIEQAERFADSIAIALEQRRTQALLADERERLLVTLRSIGDGVIATDIHGRIVLMNKVAEHLTGWPLAEALGKPLTEVFAIVSELTRKACENPVEKVLKTGDIVTLENHTVLIRRDKSEVVIADSGAPIRDSQSVTIGVVLVFRDDTEKQRSRDAMRKAEKLESLGVLAGGIAHDFNNLLGGLFGYLDLARDAIRNDVEAARYLEKAFSVFVRAKDLTGQLLTFAKGGAPARKTKALEPLINDTVQFALSGSTIKPVFEIAPDIFPCDVDENQMCQVIDNIVINARDAMPQGGAITISAINLPAASPLPKVLKPGNYVRISIRDQGGGIAPQHLPHIFDPFFTTKQKGSGLGLAVSYSIISRHDGVIDVESEMGKGSVFHIYLPASSKIASLESFGAELLLHKGSGRVLIMDDEEFIRDIASTILRSLGYETVSASSGEKAIEKFSEALKAGTPFSLAILDLTVPGGMGGKEAKDRLRALSPDIAVIASSGYSDDPVIARPGEHGFDASVKKPYKKEELMETVAMVLRKRTIR